MYRARKLAACLVLALLSVLFTSARSASTAAPCSGFPPVAVTYVAQTDGLGGMSYQDGNGSAEKVVRGHTRITVSLAGCAGARMTLRGQGATVVQIIPGAKDDFIQTPVCMSGLQYQEADCFASTYPI